MVGVNKLPHLNRQMISSFLYFIKGNHRRLHKLKDQHKDKRCFIIGNGPSIKKQDLTQLKNEFTFVTNWFVKWEKFDELQINYYCSSDPVHWNWHGSGKMPEGIYKPLEKHPELVKFFEHSAENAFRRQKVLLGPEVYFIRLDYTHTVSAGVLSLDITKRVFLGNTVIIDFCLPIAYYMGFKEFYLLGCDMDYNLQNKTDYRKGSYFYDVNEETGRKAPETLRTGEWQETVFEAYRVVKRIFEDNGRKIYNATDGGKLEVFERVDYDSLF